MPSSEETRVHKGYSLFDEIEDGELRNRNRGVTLRNIAIQGRSEKDGCKLRPSATLMLMEYFNLVPVQERKDVMKEFVHHCSLDGFQINLGK